MKFVKSGKKVQKVSDKRAKELVKHHDYHYISKGAGRKHLKGK